MEVDNTIQEEFVEDVDYISAMKLAVSDDEDVGSADSGGCRVDTTTSVTANRENGGGAAACNKRKLLYDLHQFAGKEGEMLLGFDEDCGKPAYGSVEDKNPDGNGEVAVDSECVVAPPKKSRSSLDVVTNNNISQPQVSSSTPVIEPSVDVPPVAAPVAPIVMSKSKSTKDEIYKKPFEYGWKRELVYRANPDASKDKAEVYFIAPTGKKTRSRNEIIPLLDGELTIEHFCFVKEPLGLSPDFEIVRNAKSTHRAVAEVNITSSSASSGKRISKPKAPKGASPPPQGWTPTRALKNSSSLNSNSNSPAVGNVTAASPKSTPKSAKSRKIGGPQPCTMQCVAAMGMIPQLQCIKCLCLYHHECVGLDSKDTQYRLLSNADEGGQGHNQQRKDYICQSCVPTEDPCAVKENLIAAKEPEKLLVSLIKPSLTCLPPSSAPSTTSATDPPKPFAPSIDAKPIAAISKTTPVAIPADMPQSIAVIRGKKYVVVKKPSIQRSTVCASVIVAENNTVEPIVENDVTNDRSKRFNSSANSHRKHTASSATSTTTAAASSTTGVQSTTNTTSAQSSPAVNSNSQAQQINRQAEHTSASTTLSFASDFFANVSVGYSAILHILKYLKIHERPRAASVCKIWNLVAKDRSLWQTVRMKNSKVSNWAGFTAALRRGETKHLDLRKLLVSSTKLEETWSEFCKHIGTVTSLEHIDMCRCSAQVVETLFLTNRNLTILSALAINDDSINLINIDNLLLLEELRLRTLEKCALEGDLSPLRSLKGLRHLTISSVQQLGTKGIEVIGELKNLVSLELGECNDFDSKFTDNVLPNLSKLERLRLEIGQEQCRTLDILNSVAKLESLSQLEFVNFDIKPGFDDKLSQCTNIRKLLIIPTYISQSATTNNIVLNAVLKLKDTLQVFTWGVTVELLRVTALYVDQCEDSTRRERRHFDECIPVLKPVPGSTVAEPAGEELAAGANAVPQIEILPLDKVEEILRANLITTKFTIVKVPYHATWKQQLVE